jgi:glycosyltransferase involved in cell wall biosynthesis
MRLLIATHHGSVAGGAETYLRALLPALCTQGHDVALLSEVAEIAGLERLDTGIAVRWCIGELGAEAALRGVRIWKPDVVYFQGGLSSPDWEAQLLEWFPGMLYAHNYFGTCVSGTKMHALPSPRPCTRALGPACLLLYHPLRCGGLNPLTLCRQYGIQTHRRALLCRYRRVLVASSHMRLEYLRHGVAADRLQVLPYFPAGMQPLSVSPSERALTDRILLAGRLTALKGGQFLLSAMQRAARALGRALRLVLVGDGPERIRLEKLGRQLNISIEAHGWVHSSRVGELLRQVDVVAVPSLWPEPFGLIGIEAGCLGIPAVGYAVGGIPDWLRPGESGELAPGDPPTIAGLADAIVRALRDPAHLTRLGRGAWQVAQQFTLERHIAGLIPLLEQAARG